MNEHDYLKNCGKCDNPENSALVDEIHAQVNRGSLEGNAQYLDFLQEVRKRSVCNDNIDDTKLLEYVYCTLQDSQEVYGSLKELLCEDFLHGLSVKIGKHEKLSKGLESEGMSIPLQHSVQHSRCGFSTSYGQCLGYFDFRCCGSSSSECKAGSSCR